jgi:hypothetical protein
VTESVSVVVTTHYRNDTLRDAIESALAQTQPPHEILVVDDSGECHAEPVAAEYDIQYLPHEANRGQVTAWHTGVAACRGRYVQLLDDDDRLHEEKLATQIDLLADRPARIAYCGFEWSDGERVMPPSEGHGDVLNRVLSLDFPACTTSTLLVEQSLLAEVLPLPPYEGGTDIPLKIELAARSAYEYVDRPLVYRRREPGSQGQSMAAMLARRRVLDEYEELYAAAPPAVRQRATAMSHRLVAETAVRNRRWSARAVACYLRAALADPSTRRYDLGRALLAALGRPGLALGGRVAASWRSLRGKFES